jgi:hypothetical protein
VIVPSLVPSRASRARLHVTRVHVRRDGRTGRARTVAPRGSPSAITNGKPSAKPARTTLGAHESSTDCRSISRTRQPSRYSQQSCATHVHRHGEAQPPKEDQPHNTKTAGTITTIRLRRSFGTAILQSEMLLQNLKGAVTQYAYCYLSAYLSKLGESALKTRHLWILLSDSLF